MVRKLAAIATTSLFVGGDEPTVSLQLTILTGIFIAALLLQAIFRPHSSKLLFRLEVLGLLGCTIMVYCASYFTNTIGAAQPAAEILSYCFCFERFAP